MPVGSDDTTPVPVPARWTSSWYWRGSNCALTRIALLTFTVHGPVPTQPPPVQPAKVDVASATAVSVTMVLPA